MDEMGELRKANPVSVDEAAELVAIDRAALQKELVDDRGPRIPGPRPTPSGDSHRHSRKTLAAALAVAAVFFGLMGFVVVNRLDDGGVIEASVAAPSRTGEDAVLVRSGSRGFDRSTDLLVVHFDYGDRSDGHAAVAAREVAAWFNVNPVVVAGTQAQDSDRSVHDHVPVMDAAWDDLWLDAANDRPAALSGSLERWIDTLEAGGQVWVAEGGVSDFTAEIVRELRERRPTLDAQAVIHVVQHHARSEAETRSADLIFTQANTAYERIDRGDATNATANLAGSSDGFERAVLSGGHRDRWLAAFDYLPDDDLDFSDTVSLLHILGVGTEHVANPDGFAAFFIGDQPGARLRGGS